jgi:hypothetical protein
MMREADNRLLGSKRIGSITRGALECSLMCVCAVAFLATPAWSHPPDNDHAHNPPIPSTVPPDDVCRKTTPPGPCDTDHNRPEHGSLGNVGAKLADPTSNIWAMAMSFNAPAFYDGNVNKGDSKVGGAVALEPIMPIPVYGEGKDQWKMITRPVIPIVFSEPVPKPGGHFSHIGGIGDVQLTTALVPPASFMKQFAPAVGGWIVAGGPQWYIPTATNQNLGKQQFGMGPALIAGYKNKDLTAVTLTSYTFGIANRSDKNGDVGNLSQMSMLYALIFNLPAAWQIGMNPSISYNDKAARSGDKWSVPIGLFGAKTIKIGRLPVNIRLGLEYSVVSPDTFGQRAQMRLQIQPVIPGLIQNSIFGGD